MLAVAELCDRCRLSEQRRSPPQQRQGGMFSESDSKCSPIVSPASFTPEGEPGAFSLEKRGLTGTIMALFRRAATWKTEQACFLQLQRGRPERGPGAQIAFHVRGIPTRARMDPKDSNKASQVFGIQALQGTAGDDAHAPFGEGKLGRGCDSPFETPEGLGVGGGAGHACLLSSRGTDSHSFQLNLRRNFLTVSTAQQGSSQPQKAAGSLSREV